jgi:hypothetical protein
MAGRVAEDMLKLEGDVLSHASRSRKQVKDERLPDITLHNALLIGRLTGPTQASKLLL